MLVRVRGIPIRYGSKTYRKGDALNIDEKHYNAISKYVDKLPLKTSQEEFVFPTEGISADTIAEGDIMPIKQDNGITEEYLENLPYNDLKTFLKDQGLNIGKRRKHSEILEFAKEQLLEG